VWAGVTTFMVMAYIIFVNPAILSFSGIEGLEGQGPPFDQVLVATCIAAGLMTLIMGLVTNRPFALAPGMGLNALVAYQLILGAGLSWPEAMGVIVLEGLLISVLVLIGLREAVMHAIPLSLKHAIGAGIGFFILFIGLVNGGLVRVPIESAPVIDGVIGGQPATPLALGALDNLPVAVTLLGLAITVWLHVRGVRFAVLAGIALTTLAAIALNAARGPRSRAQPRGAAAAGTARHSGRLHDAGDALGAAGRLFDHAHRLLRHDGHRDRRLGADGRCR
jgi:AGZA family xanthine/uracil permease-like MFS transporter